MNQFDLSAALAGYRVVTRDGRHVSQIMLFRADQELWPVAGVVDDLVHLFSIAGKSGEDHKSMPCDLFMEEAALAETVSPLQERRSVA